MVMVINGSDEDVTDDDTAGDDEMPMSDDGDESFGEGNVMINKILVTVKFLLNYMAIKTYACDNLYFKALSLLL